MKSTSSFSLKTKLSIAFLAIGMLPLGFLAWVTINASYGLMDGTGLGFQSAASDVSELIDRNLFERYGDVQAFAANPVLMDKSSWYEVGSGKNKIAAMANTYSALYGFYPLSIVVDTEGRVIAVNDRNNRGEPIQTSGIYTRNFKDAPWFKAVMAGQFLKSSTVNGTFVQDVHIDEDTRTVSGGNGMVLTFSAPVKNERGEVIAIWHNKADFSLVEEIVASTYKKLRSQGMQTAELTILNQKGTVMLDFDPASNGGKLVPNRDPGVILKLNLVENGVETARKVTNGESGWDKSTHARKKVVQVCGFSSSQGALGFPGLKWGVLVRVNATEALAAAKSIRTKVYWVLAVGAALLLIVATILGQRVSGPILTWLDSLQEAGKQVAAASAQIASASQQLAKGASDQVAALEETGASLEEMTSMVKRTAEGAARANSIASETRAAADAGTTDMAEMTTAMNEIKASSSEVAKIVRTIDEIAFQTNILALNAAVEAARAGEAGAGFAVVADEVRNLAQRSAFSARETASKIEDAITKSERGVGISRKVASSFEMIASKTRQVSTHVADIANASGEQAQGIVQVNTAMKRMEGVTQQAAASAEECASASEELNGQAESVKESVATLQQLVAGGNSGTEPAHRNSNSISNSKSSWNEPEAGETTGLDWEEQPAPAHRGHPVEQATAPGQVRSNRRVQQNTEMFS